MPPLRAPLVFTAALACGAALVAAACGFTLEEPIADTGDGAAPLDGAALPDGAAPPDAPADALGEGSAPPVDGGAGDASLDAMLAARVTSGLVALYLFDEDGGATVFDHSGVSPALDLTIASPGAVQHAASGLTLQGPNAVRSQSPAAKIVSACAQSNELTVEAWAASAPVPQGSSSLTAFIVALALDATNESFGLGLAGSEYRFRVHELGGSADALTTNGAASTARAHVVGTHASGGATTLYLNGAPVGTAGSGGGPFSWNESQLTVGNTEQGDRPWTGTISLVAIYSRALSQAEVQQNLAAGR